MKDRNNRNNYLSSEILVEDPVVRSRRLSGVDHCHVISVLTSKIRLVSLFSAVVLAAVCSGCTGFSASSSANRNIGALSVPAAPAGLQATAGDTKIALTWTPTKGATTYHVKRSAIGDAFTQVGSSGSASFVDAGLKNGTKYSYVISAANSAGEGANSATVAATPAATEQTPAAPVNLSAAPGNGQVTLSWISESGAISYRVKRSMANGGPYGQIGTTTSTGFNDTGLTNGITYFYVLTALNGAAESGASSQVSAMPKPAAAVPSAPTGLSVTAGDGQVRLTWTSNQNATSYNVKRSASSGGPYSIVDGGIISTFCTDTAVSNGNTYYYVVTAMNSAGESGNSGQVSARPAAPPAPVVGEAAIGADTFVDSVGVNVHLHYTNTPYANFAAVEKALKDLGVRHIRDGLIDTTWSPYYDRLNELGRSGIKATLITSVSESAALLAAYPGRVAESMEAYEAPNEYDNSGDPNWASTLNTFVAQLHSAVKSNASASQFPIVGPSLTRSGSYGQVASSGGSFDDANLHNYLGGHNPGTAGWGGGGYGSIVWNLNLASVAWPGKPVMTTETGYVTDVSQPNGVPEDVAGRYLPRVLLEQWMHGIKKTYIYELVDVGAQIGDNGFGLLHSDFSPKPAYNALKNVLNLLSDPGPTFQTGGLDFKLSGNLTNIHHLLLQKRDGMFYLAIWVEQPSYDVNAKKQLSVPAQQVTVQTERQMRMNVHQIDASGNMQNTTLGIGQTQTIEVNDLLTILEISQ